MTLDIYREGEYLSNNPSWHVEDSPKKVSWISALLDRNAVRPRSVAEVGCGAGEILVGLRALYPDVLFTGFEISPQAFDACHAKASTGLDFLLEDLTVSTRPPYDLLLIIDVFEHVPDYLGFIEKLRQRADLKVFHIPLDLSVSSIVRGKALDRARSKLGHLHYYTKETALASLRYAGYEIIDHNFTNGSQELPNRKLRTRLTNLPRRLVQAFSKDLAARLFGGYSLLVLAR